MKMLKVRLSKKKAAWPDCDRTIWKNSILTNVGHYKGFLPTSGKLADRFGLPVSFWGTLYGNFSAIVQLEGEHSVAMDKYAVNHFSPEPLIKKL